DVGGVEACVSLADRVLEALGRVDILVNNASDFPRTPLAALVSDGRGFDAALRPLVGVHMAATLYLGARLGLLMKRNGWGRIVNITDRVVVRGQAYRDWALYLATKYGLYGVTQVLAEELAPEVAVNSIAP